MSLAAVWRTARHTHGEGVLHCASQSTRTGPRLPALASLTQLDIHILFYLGCWQLNASLDGPRVKATGAPQGVGDLELARQKGLGVRVQKRPLQSTTSLHKRLMAAITLLLIICPFHSGQDKDFLFVTLTRFFNIFRKKVQSPPYFYSPS